ncbi:MAG: HisA/HisF-related TIM barrel protein [Scrofimicrobium sp.]
MLTNRLVACFDVKDGRVTKALQFQDNIDVGDPAELSKRLYEEQIDEIVFYDIMASAEKRRINLDTVKEVASNIFVPLTVGGGIKNLDDMHAVLESGAEKISIDSMAVRNPDIITQGANEFGVQCMVVSLQAQWVGESEQIPSGYEIAIDGARTFTGMDAVEWAKRAYDLGAGEIVVNSIDRDGTGEGYELTLTGAVADAVRIPVIASGGAGTAQHIADGFNAGATAAIISSMLYSPRTERNYSVPQLKQELTALGANIRPVVVP